MGSLRTLTVLLTLGAWGVATEGSPPDTTTPTAGPSGRPAPPAPPRDYVAAAARLVKDGDARAAQYIKAADDYRDMLTPQEQATLDGLKVQLAASLAPAQYAPAPVAEPAAAPTAAVAPTPMPAATPATSVAASGLELRGARDDKQSASWLLRQARDLLAQGRVDEAQQKVDEVKGMNIKWSLFEDTPARVEAAIAKVRPKQPAPVAATTKGDRRQAKEQLKQAREALAAGNLDQAEALAREVAGWGLHFGILEDNPNKVVDAVREVRKRDLARHAGPDAGAAQDLYGVLIQEARAALQQGQFSVAEEKALHAQRMNVVPPLTADRAEAVLHDLAMIKARGGAGAAPMLESPSTRVEREANELLAAGNQEAAQAKFVEAERLRAQETAAVPALDPHVQQVQTPAGAPDLTPVAPPATLTLTPAGSEPPAAPAGLPEVGAPALTEPVAAAPTQTAPANQGEVLIEQARALVAAGGFDQARKLAEQAKAGGFGVEAKADDLLAQIALTEQGGALKLYETALDALRKQDFDRARALLTEAASMEIQDSSLMEKVQDLLTRIPGEKPGTASLGALSDAEAVKAQKLNVEVGTKVAEARRLLETDPDKAITLLQTTLTAVQNAEVSESHRKMMTRRLEVAIELAKKDKTAFDEKMKDKQYRAEIEAKRLRILEADKAKKAQVEELMTKAKEAEAMGNLVEAEQYAKRAAEVDPSNLAATALATVVRTRRHYELDKSIEEEKDEGALTAFQEVSRAGIANPEVQTRGIEFAKDFSDLTNRRRELAARLAIKKDPAIIATEAKLEERVTLPGDREQPLGEVLNYLSSYSGLNIVLDPKALGEEGLTRETPIQLGSIKDIRLKTALKLMLQPLNLTYKVGDDGVVLITSPQLSRTDQIVRAYSVADLVISPHRRRKGEEARSPAELMSPTNLPGVSPPGMSPVNPALDGQGGTPTVPGMGGNNGAGTSVGEANISREDFEPLIQLIKASIAPGTWREGPEDLTGGGYGLGFAGGLGGDLTQVGGYNSITPFYLNISLIIRATGEIHDEVVDLLRQLRRLQDLQISVEVRFITVSDSFFEEIGVDFDFAIQSDVVGKKSSFAIPNPAAVPTAPSTGGTTGGTTTTNPPYLINPARDHSYGARQPLVVGTNGPTNDVVNPQFTPNLMLPFVQDSFSAITPFNALTTNTGATFGLAFLSDLEVYFFMKAVQGDQRSNLVQAPKVTTFNGAPASVFNQTQRWFVASLFPIVGAGAVAFQPSISQIPDGVTLFVTPVVSADRRYVRMTLAPFFINFLEFQTFTVPAAVGGGGLGGQATGINGQVQLPVFSITNVNTTVTVPDGGTVLLGGVKRLREQRLEFGVPILAKTPLINRLFKNIGIGRTTDSLMIMVTPRIIILEEEEERLGIPAVQNVTF